MDTDLPHRHIPDNRRESEKIIRMRLGGALLLATTVVMQATTRVTTCFVTSPTERIGATMVPSTNLSIDRQRLFKRSQELILVIPLSYLLRGIFSRRFDSTSAELSGFQGQYNS